MDLQHVNKYKNINNKDENKDENKIKVDTFYDLQCYLNENDQGFIPNEKTFNMYCLKFCIEHNICKEKVEIMLEMIQNQN
jgi:hypothetical protein